MPRTKKRIAVYSVAILIAVALMAALTFLYLRPRALTCAISEYEDKTAHRCLSCAPVCESCQAGGESSCRSCKGNMYLVIREEGE